MRTFTVTGRGEFPKDMLRRDDARAADDRSQTHIDASYANDDDMDRRDVVLTTENDHITEGRWRSFGWPVTAGGDTASDQTAWTVGIEVIQKDGPTVSTSAQVDRLDPEGPMFGACGDAVQALVRSNPALRGLEPYMMNGIMGVFACLCIKMEHELTGRFGALPRTPDSLRSKIAWMPGYELSVEIR